MTMSHREISQSSHFVARFSHRIPSLALGQMSIVGSSTGTALLGDFSAMNLANAGQSDEHNQSSTTTSSSRQDDFCAFSHQRHFVRSKRSSQPTGHADVTSTGNDEAKTDDDGDEMAGVCLDFISRGVSSQYVQVIEETEETHVVASDGQSKRKKRKRRVLFTKVCRLGCVMTSIPHSIASLALGAFVAISDGTFSVSV